MSNPSPKSERRQQLATKGYEPRDANAKWLFGIVASLVVAGLIMHFCLAGVMARLGKIPAPSDSLTGTRHIAGTMAESKSVPHLQLSPPEDLKKFRAGEEAELNSYGWINRTAGVVRIPVLRAMDLVLQRGLPVRSGTYESPTGPSSYQLQQERPNYPQPEIQGKK